MNISSPLPFRVFQRTGTTGDIAITGNVVPDGGARAVEARFNGGAWQALGTFSGDFAATLTGQAQGQGTLEVRLADLSETRSVANIGNGDVFIIAGQSNASGRGTNNQAYSHASLKATLFGNDYLWKELIDPTDSGVNQVDMVSYEALAAGSPWPLLATLHMADRSVPVAFVPCALKATYISQWLPDIDHQNRATLYGSMVYRALQTGCRAVLWHLGEGDVSLGTDQATFNSRLDTIANTVAADLGVKLIPCKLQDLSAAVPPLDESVVNAAIVEAWGDNANVLTGPDFSDIAPSVDGVHFKTDAELQTAADRWWTAIETAFGW